MRQEAPPGYSTQQLPAAPSYEKAEELPPTPPGHNARQLSYVLPSSEETQGVTESEISFSRDVNNISPDHGENNSIASNETEIEDDHMGETDWRLGSNRGRGHVPPKSEVYWKTSWLNESRGIGNLDQTTSPRTRSPPARSPFTPGRKSFSPGRKPPRFRVTFNTRNGGGLEKIDEEPRKNSNTVTNQHEFKPYGDQLKDHSRCAPKTSHRQKEQTNSNNPVDKEYTQDRSSPESQEKPEQQKTLFLQDVRLKDGTADWVENDGRADLDYWSGNTGHTDAQSKEWSTERDRRNDTDNSHEHSLSTCQKMTESTPPHEKDTSAKEKANVKYSDKRRVPTERRFNLAKDCPRWDRCEYHENNRCPYRHPDKLREKYSNSTINDGEGIKARQDYNASERNTLEAPSGGEKIRNALQASSDGNNVFTTPQTEYRTVHGKVPSVYENQISPQEKGPEAAFTPCNSPSNKQLLGFRWKGDEKSIGGSKRLFSTPKSASDVEEGALKRCSKKDMCPKHMRDTCPFLHPSEERKYRIKPEVINTWVYGKPDPCYSGEECPRKMRCPFIHEEDFKEKRVILLGTATWDEHNLGDEIWDEIKSTGNDRYVMSKEESWEDNNQQNQNVRTPEMVGVTSSDASWMKHETHEDTSASAIFDEWIEEQSDVLYSAASAGLKDVQPEPVTPDVSNSVAPTAEWAIEQDTLSDKAPCSEWFSRPCNTTSYIHDEIIPPRFRHTIKTSDEHKAQFLYHTNDTGFHSPEQTALTDRRTIMWDVVSGNNCSKITDTVSSSKGDADNEKVAGVCDDFSSNGQRTKWLAINNGDFQVPNEKQSLGPGRERKTCTFGCQFPEVEKKPEDSHSSVQATNEEHEGHMVRRKMVNQNACAQEVSGARPEVEKTCLDTEGSTADQMSCVENNNIRDTEGSTADQMSCVENNNIREHVKRKNVALTVTGTRNSKVNIEPNTSAEERKKQQTGQGTSDAINRKRPEVRNDKMRKVKQRECEATKGTDGAKKSQTKRKKKNTLANLNINTEDGATSTDDAEFNVGEGDGQKGDANGSRKRRNAPRVHLKNKNEEPDVIGGSDLTSQGEVQDHPTIRVQCEDNEENLTGAHTKESKECKDKTQSDEYEPNKITVQQTVGKPDKQHTNEDRKERIFVKDRRQVKTSKGVRHKVLVKQRVGSKSQGNKGRTTRNTKITDHGPEPAEQKEKTRQEVNNVLSERAPVKMKASTGGRILGNAKAEGRNRDPMEHKTAISSGSHDNVGAQIQRDVTDADCCLNTADATQDKIHQSYSSHAGTSDQTQTRRDRSSRENMDLDELTTRSNELKRNKGWRSRASYKGIDRRHHHRTYNERGRNNREEEPDKYFPEFNRKCGESRETSEGRSSSKQMSESDVTHQRRQEDWRMSIRGRRRLKRRESEATNQERESQCQKQGDRDHQHNNKPETGSGTKKPEVGEDVNGTVKSEMNMRNIGAKNVRNPRVWDSNLEKPWSECRGGDQHNRRKSLPRVKRPDRPIYDAGLARRRSDQYNSKVRYERV